MGSGELITCVHPLFWITSVPYVVHMLCSLSCGQLKGKHGYHLQHMYSSTDLNAHICIFYYTLNRAVYALRQSNFKLDSRVKKHEKTVC